MKSPLRRWSLRSRLVLGVVLLTALGFILSSVVAQSALQNYLLDQVDNELVSISGYTLPRVAESGLAPDDEDENEYWEGHRERPRPARSQQPLQRIPTTTSVTLIDAQGNVISELGGDLNTASASSILKGFTPDQALEEEGEPFTISRDGENFRAIAQVLPNGAGTAVAAQSLGELEKTIQQLRFFFLLIGLLLITLVAIASRSVIKIGMRPLEDVERTAEEIKMAIGSAYPLAGENDAEIRGRDLATGLPKTIVVTAAEIRKALEEPVNAIVNAVKGTLDKCPPELSSDLMDRGIVLTGGGALLKGLDERLRKETGMPIHIAERPLDAVVEGSGKCIEEFEALEKVLISEPRR